MSTRRDRRGARPHVRIVLIATTCISSLSGGCAPRYIAQPGDMVRVRIEGSRIEGRLLRTVPDSLGIEWAGGTTSLERRAVDRLEARRAHSPWARLASGALALGYLSLFVQDLSGIDRDWKAHEAIEAGAAVGLAVYFGYQAFQDSVWVRARLPDPDEAP